MGLQDVLTAFAAQAQTDVRLPANTTFFFGPVELPRHIDPPRVVWVPLGATYDSAENGGANPQQIYTRHQIVEAHCWGADFATAETMADVILVAAYQQARAVVTPTKLDQGKPDNLQKGWAFIATFEVLIPVVRVDDQTSTITTIPLIGEIVGTI